MKPEQDSEIVSEKEAPSALKTLHTVTPLSKYLAMLLFVILPFLGGWVGYNLTPEKVVEIEGLVVESEDRILKEIEIVRNAYMTERLENSEYGGECGDSSLVFYDENGTRKVIEESLGAAVEPLQLDERNHLCKGSMGMVTFHLDEGKVFLKQNSYEGGRCLGGAVYEYDVNTGILRYLNVNSSLGQLCVLSPDNTRVASTKYESLPYTDDPKEYAYRSQEIIITDLLNDSSFVALELNDDEETFVGSRDGYGPFGKDTFEWINENTLEYKIYDVTTTEYGNGNWGHPYIESRTLSLDPTDQNLQTYRNEEYGFGFQYPQNFSLSFSKDNSVGLDSPLAFGWINLPDEDAHPSAKLTHTGFSVYKYPGSLEGFVESRIEDGDSLESAKVGEADAFKSHCLGCGIGYEDISRYLVIKNGFGYEFSAEGGPSSSVLDELIKTVNFFDPENSPEAVRVTL